MIKFRMRNEEISFKNLKMKVSAEYKINQQGKSQIEDLVGTFTVKYYDCVLLDLIVIKP